MESTNQGLLQPEALPQLPERHVGRGPKKRTGASKYDLVKVKVWLGEHLQHHYILSRFLICRMLTVTRIPLAKATKIALELKKQLVDSNRLDITQVELEEALFQQMEAHGYGSHHVECYRLVSSFMAARQPLVVILCGAPWTGKSTIAQQLAARLNMPNVMRTSLAYDLLQAGGLAEDLHPLPLQARPDLQGTDALLDAFVKECRTVRKALSGDFNKAVKDGKPLIIEGSHLDPAQLLPELEAEGLVLLPMVGEEDQATSSVEGSIHWTPSGLETAPTATSIPALSECTFSAVAGGSPLPHLPLSGDSPLPASTIAGDSPQPGLRLGADSPPPHLGGPLAREWPSPHLGWSDRPAAPPPPPPRLPSLPQHLKVAAPRPRSALSHSSSTPTHMSTSTPQHNYYDNTTPTHMSTPTHDASASGDWVSTPRGMEGQEVGRQPRLQHQGDQQQQSEQPHIQQEAAASGEVGGAPVAVGVEDTSHTVLWPQGHPSTLAAAAAGGRKPISPAHSAFETAGASTPPFTSHKPPKAPATHIKQPPPAPHRPAGTSPLPRPFSSSALPALREQHHRASKTAGPSTPLAAGCGGTPGAAGAVRRAHTGFPTRAGSPGPFPRTPSSLMSALQSVEAGGIVRTQSFGVLGGGGAQGRGSSAASSLLRGGGPWGRAKHVRSISHGVGVGVESPLAASSPLSLKGGASGMMTQPSSFALERGASPPVIMTPKPGLPSGIGGGSRSNPPPGSSQATPHPPAAHNEGPHHHQQMLHHQQQEQHHHFLLPQQECDDRVNSHMLESVREGSSGLSDPPAAEQQLEETPDGGPDQFVGNHQPSLVSHSPQQEQVLQKQGSVDREYLAQGPGQHPEAIGGATLDAVASTSAPEHTPAHAAVQACARPGGASPAPTASGRLRVLKPLFVPVVLQVPSLVDHSLIAEDCQPHLAPLSWSPGHTHHHHHHHHHSLGSGPGVSAHHHSLRQPSYPASQQQPPPPQQGLHMPTPQQAEGKSTGDPTASSRGQQGPCSSPSLTQPSQPPGMHHKAAAAAPHGSTAHQQHHPAALHMQHLLSAPKPLPLRSGVHRTSSTGAGAGVGFPSPKGRQSSTLQAQPSTTTDVARLPILPPASGAAWETADGDNEEDGDQEDGRGRGPGDGDDGNASGDDGNASGDEDEPGGEGDDDLGPDEEYDRPTPPPPAATAPLISTSKPNGNQPGTAEAEMTALTSASTPASAHNNQQPVPPAAVHALAKLLGMEDTHSEAEADGTAAAAGPLGSGSAQWPLSLADQVQQARVLQEYLSSFNGTCGVPLFSVRYGAYGDTVDALHEYVLACIMAAMRWMAEEEEEEEQEEAEE